MKVVNNPGNQILGVLLVAGGLIALPYTWEPNALVPDFRSFLPSERQVFLVAGVFISLILLYHFWRAQFERALSALFVFISISFVGTFFNLVLVSLAHYSEFESLGELFGAVFFGSKGSASLPYIIGRVINSFCILYGAWLAALTLIGLGERGRKSIGDFHHRGRNLISFGSARDYAKKFLGKEEGIWWGMIKIPEKVSTSHFAIVGSTGSGKTISIRLLMQSVLKFIGTGRDHRAIIYDAKQDMASILSGINPPCEVLILNPFDKRGVAWNMAADITAPATAQQIAMILIPENKNASQPFFSDAARHLLSGVLISFIKNCPNSWTFRDVLVALKSQNRLREVLEATPETKDLIEQYLGDDITAKNVMSTVASKMQRYEFIAAAWSKAERSISLRDWLKEEKILLLGNDEATRTALDAINQVIFKRLSELILAQTESESRRTWVFLDELRQAGKLEGLSSLLTKGRSKGASIVLGYQDIEGLREVYGYQLGNEIAGQCANKAILRCDSSDTAQWASALFGEREVIERRESTTESSGSSQNNFRPGGTTSKGSSTQTTEQVAKREVVLPSEIMDIPPTTPENGLTGYYLTPLVGAYEVTAPGEFISKVLHPRDKEVLDIDPRPESDQYLKPWTQHDWERLYLVGAPRSPISEDDEPNPIFQVKRRVH